MSRLDITLGRLLRPGLGLLVLDEYADAEAERRGLPPSALPLLAEHVLRSPLVGRRLGGVLLSPQHLASMPQPVAPPHASPPFVGLRVDVSANECSAPDAVRAARRAGADVVELRSNRRPGQFPRSESHVDVVPMAAAAAAAQAVGLVPVLSVALPGLDGSSIGVARAVTVNALSALFEEVAAHDVDVSRVVVRTNLVSPGRRAPGEHSAESVARFTLDALAEALPSTVPAVWFLSSGRALATVCRELEAVTALAAARGGSRHLGYAMGRALMEPALDGMVTGGLARAHQRLSAACDALHRALVPALAAH
jgi:hypothetical protein